MTMPRTDRVFYWNWVIANGWAECAGLGTTFSLGRLIAPFLENRSGAATVLGGALLAVLLGIILEGVVVGVAQERVLRQRLVELKPRSWVTATAAGAGLAWLAGMVPSTILALSSGESPETQPAEPGAMVQYALAMGLGFVTGPILGVAQWTVLRGGVEHPGRWLWANALAWAAGMPIIFAGMDLVPWSGSIAWVIVSIYAVCGVAGLVVGAIHGRLLVQLLPSAD